MEGAKLVKAFQNIPGVEVANVDRLNLLKLAPSGHLGRFVIWTKSAFEKLDSIYGSFEKKLRRRRMGTCCPVQKWLMLIWLGILNSVPSPLACLNLRPKKSGFGSANSGLDAPNSPRIFTGCLSATEMELSEYYTCVISHRPILSLAWHAWPPLGGHS